MRILLVIVVSSLFSTGYAAITYHTQLYDLKVKNYNVLKNVEATCGYLNSGSKGDHISIIYGKAPGNEYFLICLLASKSLEMSLPSKVLKFIGNRMVKAQLAESNSLDAAKAALQAAVEKALDKTWVNALVNEGDTFAHNHEYDRNYAGFDMNYYEFFPIERNDIANPTTIDEADLKKSFFVDTILSSERTLIGVTGKLKKFEDSNLKKPDFDRTISWQEYRYNNLVDVMNKLDLVGYHHQNMKVSDWPLIRPNNWELPETLPDGFHTDVDTACKYLMVLQPTLKKNELMPAMAWKQNYSGWKATRCNVFVGDFAQQKLKLPTYPWGRRDWDANDLFDALPKDKNFIPLGWPEAWLYATMGYPVFITSPRPKNGPAAHIGFAFPIALTQALSISAKDNKLAFADIDKNEMGMVVQAGGTIGKATYTKGFHSSKSARIYVYLGHLLN